MDSKYSIVNEGVINIDPKFINSEKMLKEILAFAEMVVSYADKIGVEGYYMSSAYDAQFGGLKNVLLNEEVKGMMFGDFECTPHDLSKLREEAERLNCWIRMNDHTEEYYVEVFQEFNLVR